MCISKGRKIIYLKGVPLFQREMKIHSSLCIFMKQSNIKSRKPLPQRIPESTFCFNLLENKKHLNTSLESKSLCTIFSVLKYISYETDVVQLDCI